MRKDSQQTNHQTIPNPTQSSPANEQRGRTPPPQGINGSPRLAANPKTPPIAFMFSDAGVLITSTCGATPRAGTISAPAVRQLGDALAAECGIFGVVERLIAETDAKRTLFAYALCSTPGRPNVVSCLIFFCGKANDLCQQLNFSENEIQRL